MNTEVYDLIAFDWSSEYDFDMDLPSLLVNDDSGALDPKEDLPVTEVDADGIPTSDSKEVWPKRREIINDFFSRWYEAHQPDTQVFNLPLQAYIRVRAISIIEAKEHACKSYKSTVAVVKYMDRILASATPVRNLPIKPGNKNQSKFDSMLVMKCEIPELGTVKLTVGIKQMKMTSEEHKTHYGISVLHDGQPIVESGPIHTKKAPHKK